MAAPAANQRAPAAASVQLLEAVVHEDCSDEREHQREREVQLIDPEQTEPHAGERDTVWQHADRQPRQQLERADEEHDAAGEDVGRIDNVRGEIQRPRSEEDPGPEEPTRHLRISAPDVPREQRQRGGRQQVEEDVGRFGYRQQPQRSAHEESDECARDARPGIHDIGAKPGPLTGRVVTQTDQIDLQFIVCPELVGQAKGKTKGEGNGDECDELREVGCDTPAHRVLMMTTRWSARSGSG